MGQNGSQNGDFYHSFAVIFSRLVQYILPLFVMQQKPHIWVQIIYHLLLKKNLVLQSWSHEVLSVSTCQTAKKIFICGHFNGAGSFAESSTTSSHSCFSTQSAVNTLISCHTHDFPVGNLCSWHPMQWGMKHPNYVLHGVEQCDSLKARLAHIDSLPTLWLYCVGKVVRHPRYILNAKLSTTFFFFLSDLSPITVCLELMLNWSHYETNRRMQMEYKAIWKRKKKKMGQQPSERHLIQMCRCRTPVWAKWKGKPLTR